MRKNKIVLYVFTALFLLCAVMICLYQCAQDTDIPLSVVVLADGREEHIDVWISEEGEYYVFLPGYMELSQVQIELNTDSAVFLNGAMLVNGMSCSDFQLDVPYELSYTAWGKAHRHPVTFMRSGNVAAMYIDTESGNMDFIHDKKGNEETGAYRLYTAEGGIDNTGALQSINGRGNNTWETFEKKPYSITMTEEANLLRMGTAQKWILLANAADPSNMRNKIVYEFADEIGLPYSPDSQWVDLYLNGEYAGLYLLCERNEVHPERVAIAENDSFLVSLEMNSRLENQNYTHIVTQADQALRVHYLPEVSDRSLQELTAVWQSLENAILAEDGVDPATGVHWKERIDLDSWVKKYLIEEVFGNGDACYISQFFYRDGNDSAGKIYAGPAWDYDRTLGTTVAWQMETANVFFANRYHVKDGYDRPWFYTLYRNEVFYHRLTELYQSEFLPALEELFRSRIYDYYEQIERAAAMNQIRWSHEVSDAWEDTEHIVAYMTERISFLNSLWLDDAAYHIVKADHSFGGFYCYYAVKPGECLTILPTFEDTETNRFVGWYDEATDEPFDPERPINEDLAVYAKWVDAPSKKLGQIIKLIPLGVIGVLGLVLLLIDIKRMRKSR